MTVGVVKEIKPQEHRVALTPDGARDLTSMGHAVLVEHGAGEASGFGDADYLAAGARIASSAGEVWKTAHLLLKVKEPLPQEYGLLHKDTLLFAYLHLAANRELTVALRDSGATCIAYEAVQLPDGSLPLLRPMSAVAGRLAPLVAAGALFAYGGGRGRLLCGVPGATPGDVLIVGGGTVGYHAARMAAGLGARVTIVDTSLPRLSRLEEVFGSTVELQVASPAVTERLAKSADVVIGAVLVPNEKAPRVLTRSSLPGLRRGAVLVDVAIDQGGCFETSRPTTHSNPTYLLDGIVHYCVANMPGAVPVTSTTALTSATLPYVIKLARDGTEALTYDDALRRALCIHEGNIINEEVGRTHDLVTRGPVGEMTRTESPA